MKKSTRTSRVHHQARGQPDASAATPAAQFSSVSSESSLVEVQFIDEYYTELFRLADQQLIKIRSIPMCVGDGIVGTGCDQQLIPVSPITLPALPLFMMKEGEPTLQSASHRRMRSLPTPPLGERRDPRELITAGEFFQKQVGQGRRGFADRKTRVPAPFQQCHRQPQPARD